MIVWMAVGQALAGCEQPTTNATLDQTADTLFDAFASLDAEGVTTANASLRDDLPCLSEVISVRTAAKLHRALGMSSFIRRDAPSARRYFLASRTLEPSSTLPQTVSEGNPIQADFIFLRADTSTVPIEAPPTGIIALNGKISSSRVGGIPVVYQHISTSGAVIQTKLIPADQPLPTFISPDTKPSTHRVSRPLLITAVGLGAVAAGLGAASIWSFQDYDTSVPTSWSSEKQTRTNILGASTYIAGAGAIGLGIAAFAVSGNF